MLQRYINVRNLTVLTAVLSGVGLVSATLAPVAATVGTTALDFSGPGSQPLSLTDDIQVSGNCAGCHGNYDDAVEPYRNWASSMMAQSSRDPIFHAALAIANQDAGDAGELCLRCHTPGAWLDGRATPADGSALSNAQGDFDGVTCHVCHRMVDPYADPGSPLDGYATVIGTDAGILAGLPDPVVNEPHTGQYILDPKDVRRGPFALGGNGFLYHAYGQSPYHQESLLCATCHDVSNPALSKQINGTYQLNALNTPHPTDNKLEEFPVERTYSEWKLSAFAETEIDMGGLFGGDKAEVSTCQDCHMPDEFATACLPGIGAPTRPDMPLHHFNGANSWVLRAVDFLYPQLETALTNQSIEDAIDRNEAMLANAADLNIYQDGSDLVVRVINQSGHKLPTGYGEGRRMWINVKFYNSGGTLIGEHGAYNGASADLTTTDTTVYEVKHGLDATQAAATGVPMGESFHFVLNNEILLDNRIPPRGFDLSDFTVAQAEPVNYVYLENHHWDDVNYTIPVGTHNLEVNLYHQTTSKEYIEFLRDENTTNSAGIDAYNLWADPAVGNMSPPVLMQSRNLLLSSPVCPLPFNYGIGSPNHLGEYPWISYNGTPSVSANNFEIVLSNALPGTFAALFWGSNAANIPLFGGHLLLSQPTRGPLFFTDPTGGKTLPINVTASMVGIKRYYQLLYRDAMVPSSVVLSDGLYVEFCQ